MKPQKPDRACLRDTIRRVENIVKAVLTHLIEHAGPALYFSIYAAIIKTICLTGS